MIWIWLATSLFLALFSTAFALSMRAREGLPAEQAEAIVKAGLFAAALWPLVLVVCVAWAAWHYVVKRIL